MKVEQLRDILQKYTSASILPKDVFGIGGSLEAEARNSKVGTRRKIRDEDDKTESPGRKRQCKDPNLLGKQGLSSTTAAAERDQQTQQLGTALLPLVAQDLLATLSAHAGSIKIPAAGPLEEQQAIEVAPGDSAQPAQQPKPVPSAKSSLALGAHQPSTTSIAAPGELNLLSGQSL
ncbi:hypothetical protein PTTG_03834 [Puccinia triticina 1-1 BBBD Race 1]|uniref:Uncharacterized protein n=2 Tax=Puccinia triticina TaxID=208348 RepID=A0A0C4ESQ5_PUCT1|nr:hypothetical protein PTTG_03834 [Puccinia triticina 1-1 BBBD Race 1]